MRKEIKNNKWFTFLRYTTFSQHKIDNIIASKKILTKKNAMIMSIKNDLDRLPNLFYYKDLSKQKEYTYFFL